MAVRCLARNEVAAVAREVKLVSNGEKPGVRDCRCRWRLFPPLP